MSDVQANVIIKADDQASSVVQHAGEAMQELQDRTEDAKGGMQGFNAESILTIATGISMANALQVGVDALKRLTEESLEAAGQMQIFQSKAQVLWGTDLPGMSTALGTMAEQMGRSQGEILGTATSIAAFSTSMGVGKQQSEEMSLGMTNLAVDIEKATGADQQDSVNKLEMALRGMGRGLTEVGIDESATALDTYMATQGLHEKYTALDDASKAIVAYHYLLSQEPNLLKEAALNEGGYVEQTKELDSAWQTLEETLGSLSVGPATSIISGLTGLVQTLDNSVLNLAKDFSASNVFNLLGGINTAGGDYVPQIGDNASNAPEGPQTQDSYLTSTLQLTEAQAKEIESEKKWQDTLAKAPSVSKGAAKAMETLQTEMDALGTTYDTVTQDIGTKLEDLDRSHAEKMDQFKSDIEGVQEKMTDLKNTYTQAIDDINNKTLDQVGAQFKKVADLAQAAADQSNSKGALDDDQVTSIIANRQDKTDTLSQRDINAYQIDSTGEKQINDILALQREEKSLGDYLTQNIKLTQQQTQGLQVGNADFVKNAQAILSANPALQQGLANAQGTDFDRFLSQQAQDKASKTADYNKQQASLDDEKKALDDKVKVEQAAYGAQRTELINTQIALTAFHGTYVAALNDMADVTKTQITAMKQELQELSQVMTQAQATSLGKARVAQNTTVPQRAGGGTANEPYTLVGEQGPELVSLPQGSYVHTASQTKDMLGGGGVTIQGPLVGAINVQNAADEDRLIGKLKTLITRDIQLQNMQSSSAR